ncbi:MAG TPA: hypothetical protein VFS37_07425 [Conexibacter sp.]|nr:hypothetical protein [Conexibacter sp.]
MSAFARHLLRSLAIAFLVAAVPVLALALDASAYVTASGTTSARASVTTLAAPSITRTTTGSGSVTLTWSAISAPASGTVTYYVTRDGGEPAGNCPTSTAASAVTTCTDTGLSVASHTYTVTAVWRSWKSTSARASATVTQAGATQLVFTTSPGSATGGSAFGTQPVVTARNASNQTVTDYNGTVTLSIVAGTGTAGAVLSSCTGTLRNGVTTFSGCAIDRVGSNYRLRASDGTLSGDSSAFSVTAGTAVGLVFTTQPGGGATGGTQFPTQPVVTAVDAGGNTATGSSSTVSLAIVSGTGTAGADLDNCDSSRRNGVTTFDNCEIDLAGIGYQLRASTFGGLRADSAAFDVAVGPISRLDFTTEPAGAVVRAPFATQPVVTAQDAGGNTVTSYNGTIALSIVRFSGASGATLSGCRGTLASGVTTFAGCQLDKVASDYQLRASDGTRTTDTNDFAVLAGPATQLLFTTSPASASGGTAFGTQPVVTARDADGNTATSYGGTVTLAIVSGTGTAGATLSACTGSLRSGVVTFSGCKIDRAGSNYRLRASDGTLSADSSAFNVSVGSTAALLFTTQPGNAFAGVAFGIQPVLTAVDAGGNTVTSYNSTITLSIVSGTGNGGTLSSCSSSRSNGVTTFSSCRISRAGSGYVLRANDGTRSVNSAAFDVR